MKIHRTARRQYSIAVLFILAVLFLQFFIFPKAHASHERIEVLADKTPASSGICGFKNKQLAFFAAGNVLAPKSQIDQLENCVMFSYQGRINPLWFLILNKDNEPQEVIEWEDPAIFRSVWRTGLQI